MIEHDNKPFVPPSFETISFSLPEVGDWQDYLAGKRGGWCYLTDGNPTLSELERILAKLQGQEACRLTSTGKSAMAAILLGLLRAGDHLILLAECYKSTRHFTEQVLNRFGVEHTLVGTDELGDIERFVRPGVTKVFVLESPTNPMTRVPDFEPALSAAKKHGVVTVLDNSLSGFHQHGRYPFDIFMHSLSKFASGTGDFMGGAVIGKKEIVSRIAGANCWNSDAMSASAALGIWKGMQTYELRISRQAATAARLAEFLRERSEVERVMYPGLDSHPDHAIAKKQMSDFGSVLAFDVKSGEEGAVRLLNALERFRIAFGTGFTQSIANPAWMFYARSFQEPPRGHSEIKKNTVRLSVGIEPAESLVEDLEHALSRTA